MSLDDLLKVLERNDGDTLYTSYKVSKVSLEPASIGACTSVTPDTPQKINAGAESQKQDVNKEVKSRWWRFYYTNRDYKEVSYCPEVTRAKALASEREAIGAEAFEYIPHRPVTSLSQSEGDLIQDWLEHINETDEATIATVLEQCQTDQDARVAFLRTAKRWYKNLPWKKKVASIYTTEERLL
ncbi:MAG TPA: hypothetical protein VHB01_06935 [Nitrosospira sp.]|nr:hypothetical protein [Nitrosospira sp.]